MANNVYSIKMWENTVDTPITASNLSKSINYQANDKFIHLTNNQSDIESWADVVETEFVDNPPDDYLNRRVYNVNTNTMKRVVFNPQIQQNQWDPMKESSHYEMTNKVLKISSDVQISMSYVDSGTSQRVYLNFDLGKNDQIFSFDDLMNEQGIFGQFNSNTTYYIYLLHNFSHGDRAYLKIISENDLQKDYWKQITANPLSPTGYEVIAYRQIGGFRTNNNRQIIEDSLWDLYTYQNEIAVKKINILEEGYTREMNAGDVKIKNEQSIFNASNVEGAIQETRVLLNNIRNQFYTNRRVGVNLRFTPFKQSETGAYIKTIVNELTLYISAGYIDVLGTQKVIDRDLFLNKDGLKLKVNDGDAVENVTLGNADNRLYAGVWRVFLDPSTIVENGNIIFKHEGFERPVYDPVSYGWFDSQGNRCIGKFKVRDDNGYYIEKMSVTDTFDVNVPPNTIHIHHGTLVPDGLFLCDGRWHDVKGIDPDSYTWDELVNNVGFNWGDSWYEETPNMFDRFVKMTSVANIGMNQAKDFILPTGGGEISGGSADTGVEGGSANHTHLFPHSHGKGSLNIIPGFGAHPHNDILYSGTLSEVVDVETVAAGQGISVAKETHQHNLVISGGTHSHPNDSFQGETERLEDEASRTDQASSDPLYKEMLICIKK